MAEKTTKTLDHNKKVMKRWHKYVEISDMLTQLSPYVITYFIIALVVIIISAGHLPFINMIIVIINLFIMLCTNNTLRDRLILKYDFSSSDDDILNIEELTDFKYTQLPEKPHLSRTLRYYQKSNFSGYEATSAIIERELNNQISTEEMLIFKRNSTGNKLKLYRVDSFRGDTKTLLSISDDVVSTEKVLFGVID